MKETFSHEFTGWQKLAQKYLGMWRINKESIDFRWGYFAPRFGLEFYVNRGGYDDANYSVTFCFIWGVFNVELPFKSKLGARFNPPRYGMYLHESTLNFPWGKKNRYINLPFFSYNFDHHITLGKDGTWFEYDYNKKEEYHTECHPYAYTLKSGKTQNRTATCRMDIYQWHRKWFPFLKKVRKSIDIEFSDEVGERSGSWKGGCIGCSYDMLKGEAIEQCLRRMEQERKF